MRGESSPTYPSSNIETLRPDSMKPPIADPNRTAVVQAFLAGRSMKHLEHGLSSDWTVGDVVSWTADGDDTNASTSAEKPTDLVP